MRRPSFADRLLIVIPLWLFATACGSDGTASPTMQVTITVEPEAVELVPGQTQQFTASVQGTSITAVNWTATGGTITSGGLFTAGSEPGSYSVTATSTVSQQAQGAAQVSVRAAGMVIPTWNRSDAAAGAAQNFQKSEADSADFSGFEATLFAASSTGSASTNIAAEFHRDAGTGHLSLIESESESNANNSFPGDGTPNSHNRIRLIFEVRNAPVSFTFTAECTFWGFDARLRKTNAPTKQVFEHDIMDGEFDDGECEEVKSSGILDPGTYDLQVTHTFNTPWFGMEPGTSVSLDGGYTMRLEFDQTIEN